MATYTHSGGQRSLIDASVAARPAYCGIFFTLKKAYLSSIIVLNNVNARSSLSYKHALLIPSKY